MKKYLIWLWVLLLWGCSTPETGEQILDVYEPVALEPAAITFAIPEQATMSVMSVESGDRLYFCEDYTISIQTYPAGNLDQTFQLVTGFPAENLRVFHTSADGVDRYESVWTCAGECGDTIGRLVVLDDGVFHYVLTVMADADDAGAYLEEWDALLATVNLGDAAAVPRDKGPGIV